MRPTITFILTIFALTSYSQPRLVKKQTEISVWTYVNDKGKKKTQTQRENFIVYDQQGNEIEFGNFGESFGAQVIGKDSSVSWYCGKDYSKINTVDFTSYDKEGKKIKIEKWFFNDNIKSGISDYTIFKYNNLGLLLKEITFSEKDIILKTTTYAYDLNSNNIGIVDSTFNSFLNSDRISIHKTINQFDTLKRIILTTEFLDGQLLLRKKFLYRDDMGLTTELRYDNASDTSLFSFTETKVDNIKPFPYPKKKLEKYWKVINSTTESREIYIYNKKCLLDKIEIYSGIKLTGYTKFDYEFH